MIKFIFQTQFKILCKKAEIINNQTQKIVTIYKIQQNILIN